MRKAASLGIGVSCFTALAMGLGIFACKTRAQTNPAAAVAAPKSATTPPAATKVPPKPTAPSPAPVAAPGRDATARPDSGAAREAELLPAPFYLLPPRPDCKMPPRMLIDDNAPDNLGLLAEGNGWAFIRPQNLPAKDDSGPQEEVVLPSYFAGLPPGRALLVIFKGDDPQSPPAGKVNAPEYASVKPVWVGPFSDHCLAVRPNDRSIVFSVLLADDLALQAVAHRSKQRTRVSEGGDRYYFNPVLGFEVRTVDLKTGRVRDRKLHAADPEAIRHYPIEGVWPKVKRLGATGVAVYAFGFKPPLLFLVKRSGEIPTMHELKSDTIGFGLSPKPQPQGGWKLRYHEKAKSTPYETNVYELGLDITPELTIAQ